MSDFPTTGSLAEENLTNVTPSGEAEASSIIPAASYSNTAKGSPLQGLNSENSGEPLAAAGLAAPPTEERETPQPEQPGQEEDKLSLGDAAGDLALFGLRGAEGFAESVFGLFGSKWDREDWSIFGKSKTIVGGFGENLVQFGIGLIPGLGTAGWVAKAAKLQKGSKLAKSALAARKTQARKSLGHQAAFGGKVASPIAPLAKGNRSLDLSTLRRLAKMKKKAKTAAIWGYAGAVSDFVAFKGQEARLSNMLQGMGVDNDLVNYLAYDPTQDSSEMEERLKNVIEGGFAGAALGGTIDLLGRAGTFKFLGKVVGKFRRKNQLMSEGMDEAEAIEKAEREFVEAVSEDPEMLREMADTQAQLKHEQNLRDNGALPAPARLGGDDLPFGGNENTLDVWYGSGQNKELSNLASRPFRYEGKGYLSVEHAYQTLKSGQFDAATYSNPAWKRGGVKIRGKRPADRETNVGLMETLMRESFEQNPEASKALLETKGKTITHLRDRSIWRDKFPEALTKVRSELEAAQPAAARGFTEAGEKRLKEIKDDLEAQLDEELGWSPKDSPEAAKKRKEERLAEIKKDIEVELGVENVQLRGHGSKMTPEEIEASAQKQLRREDAASAKKREKALEEIDTQAEKLLLDEMHDEWKVRQPPEEAGPPIGGAADDASGYWERGGDAPPRPQEPSSEVVPVSDTDAISVMRGPQGRHMNNTKPGEPGWLGNPFKWKGNGGKGTVEEAIDKFKQAFLKRIEEDPAFKAELEGLVGRKLGYYKPKAKKSHAQVIKSWLDEAGSKSKRGTDEFPMGEGAEGAAPKKMPLPKIKGKDATVDMVDDLKEAELNEFLSEFGDLDIPSVAGSLANKRKIAKEIIEAGEHTGQVIADIESLVTKVVDEAGDDFLTGTGDQAILAGRKLLSGVHSNEGLVALVRVLARKAIEKRFAVHGPPKNAEETFDKVEASLLEKDHWDVFDRDLAHQQLEQARGNVDALERIYEEQNMIHKLYTTLAEEVGESVKRAEKAHKTKGTVTYDVMEDGVAKQKELSYKPLLTEVYSNLDKFLAVKELWAEYGTNLSMGMLQRKFIYEGTGTGGIKRRKDLGFRPKMKGVDRDLSVEEAAYRRGVRGSRSEKQFLSELRQATNSKDIEAALSKLGSDSRNGFARTIGWYLNALLSSPVTWGVNMVGSAIMKGFRDFEVIAGATAQFAHTGNADLLRTRIKSIYDMESFMDAWKYASISLKEGEPRSIAGYTAYSDNRFEDMKSGWHFGEGDDPLTNAGNWFGNIVSAPQRILMAGDELFKQWNYRSYVKADLAMEAHRRGIKDPYEIASYVRDNFEAHMTKEGRIANESNVYKEAAQAADDKGLRFGKRAAFIDEHMDEHFYNNNMRLGDGFVYRTTEQRDLLVERATDWSLINTFTNTPSNPLAHFVSRTAMAHPWLAFAVPFVRTPTNIITFALSRVIPLPGAGKIHQSFDVQDVMDKRGKSGYGLLNPNRMTVGSEQAIMNTNRYAKAARGEDTGMEIPAAAKEQYEKSQWNEPEVKYEEIPKDKAAAYIRYDEGPTGTIRVDRERIKEMYDRKAWRAEDPRVEGVSPLDDKHFKSYEDFEEFVMEHEHAHQYLKQRKRHDEPKAAYEDRVNQEALKRLAFNRGHGKNWQKQLREQYADMPFSEAMAKEHLQAQAQAGSVAAAELHGRLTTSALMTASSLYTMELVKERVTGSPPVSRSAKAAWDAIGKKPWSVRVGEGEDAKWVSYQRMDPFATILGIFADIVHMTPAAFGDDESMGMIADDTAIEEGMGTVHKILSVITMTFSNNITNGSYVEGLYNVMEAFKDLSKAGDLGAQIAGGFVPTGLTWTENLVEKEPQIYETRKLLDHVMKKIPAYMRPDMPETPISSATLEPRRNWLGEKQKKSGPFLPSFVGLGQQVPESNDIVDMELHSLGKGFLQRPAIWSGALDTRRFRNTNGGQTAFDRHQELLSSMKIGGRTARQSIRALIEGAEYQSLPPATDMTIGKRHPRHAAIGRILDFYSNHAKNQVMGEYPELNRAYYQNLQK